MRNESHPHPIQFVASLNTRYFEVEDVFTTAHCAIRIGAHPPRHDRRFSCGQMVRVPCDMADMITGHKVTPELQFDILEALDGGYC